MYYIALRSTTGRIIFNTVLLTGVALGGLYMLTDTYSLGAAWTPITSSNDSYALITG